MMPFSWCPRLYKNLFSPNQEFCPKSRGARKITADMLLVFTRRRPLKDNYFVQEQGLMSEKGAAYLGYVSIFSRRERSYWAKEAVFQRSQG